MKGEKRGQSPFVQSTRRAVPANGDCPLFSPKELCVISGKGGTGKTSVVASLATLAQGCVLVDCDVDAADLHLIFEPKNIRCEDFTGGSEANILSERCTACGNCKPLCRFDAIECDPPSNTYRIDPTACEGCGVCVDHCPEKAIAFEPVVCGQWFVSEARCGPMVHARLGVAAENSGKLVTQVRRTAQEVAQEHRLELIICDGSPGIGCPVIASLSGASLALFVVEPTVSGIHDFRRVAQLAARLDVPGLLAINKADLNLEIADELEEMASRHGIVPAGRIPYDREVTRAQMVRQTVVEASDGPAAKAIRTAWAKVQNHLASVAPAAVGGLVQIQS